MKKATVNQTGPPKKKAKNEIPAKKDDLEPGEIKTEAQSESDAEEKVSTRSKAGDNYVIKDGIVKKTQSQKSELKIANVFRIQSKDGTVNLENCTSQFEDDLKTLRKSARKPIPTEKMRELEKTKTPTKIEEPIVKTGRNQITIKTPQSINNSIKTPPTTPQNVKQQQQPQTQNNNNAQTSAKANVEKESSPQQTPNKIQWTKVTTKDGQRTKVILSPPIKSDKDSKTPDSKVVFMKRIMQPQVMSPQGQVTKVITTQTGSTGANTQPKIIAVKSGSAGQSPKIISMNKNSLTGLNPSSIVIKKVPQKIQIRQTESPQASKTVTLKSGMPYNKAIITQLKQTNGKPITVKYLSRGESGQTKSVILKEHVTGVPKTERIERPETPKVKQEVVPSTSKELNSSQYIKQLETENNNLKGILLDLYGEVKEMKSKIENWEVTIKKALDTKTLVATPQTTPASAPVNASVVLPTTSSSAVVAQTTSIKFKSDASKVFKMPKLPITDLMVFSNFEEDLGYKKFYDLVFSRLSEMVPSRFARRTLHRYLRSIIDDDLLLNFVWDNKLSRMFVGMEQKCEMVKFNNFQNLLFSLINHHKAVNFNNGLKWSEMEQFLKNQLRNARDRAKAKVIRSKAMEEEAIKKDAMDTSEELEKDKSMSETESSDSIEKLEREIEEEAEKILEEKSQEIREKVEAANKKIEPEPVEKPEEIKKPIQKPEEIKKPIQKPEEVKKPAQKPDELKRITINPQQIKDLLNKAVVHDASKMAQIKITKKPDGEEHPKSIMITKGKTVQIVKKIISTNSPMSVKPNLVIKRIQPMVQQKKEAEKPEKPEEPEKKVEPKVEVEVKQEEVEKPQETTTEKEGQHSEEPQSESKEPDFVSCG